MPIISKIGRKNIRTRILLASIIGALAVGSVTMIYPFLLMIGGTAKSNVDETEFSIVPGFYTSALKLYRKHLQGLFNEAANTMGIVYDEDSSAFQMINPPKKINKKLVKSWESFIESENLPPYSYCVGYLQTPASRKTMPRVLREFKEYIISKYGSDIYEVNKKLDIDLDSWISFSLTPDSYFDKSVMPNMSKLREEFWKFREKEPVWNRYYFTAEGFYKKIYLKGHYSKHIAEYNKTHGTNYKSYDDVHLSRLFPVNGTKKQQEDWVDFMRHGINPLWIKIDKKALPVFHEYLKEKYETIARYNRDHKLKVKNFSEINIPAEMSHEGILLTDMVDFISGWKDPVNGKFFEAPVDTISLNSIDTMYRDYLERRYKTVAGMNKALGTDYKDFNDIFPPQRQAHYVGFKKHMSDLRWEFSKRNFLTVIDYLIIRGRGVINTVIYCGLAVFLALLINPLAAYALSRYKMPSTYKILLFLMLTMAFPPMVTQIPIFVMMKKLGLLNTFAALLLPGMANGYSIFLLKGFFDSLPQELFESASLDGASEWTMFWVITMNLSKPILAVIALNAFQMAYANFMFALLLCQDEKMWTLMVWVYQLQQGGSMGVVCASLLIAAIPTFLIFVFCQNIIMRGIVVPTEK